MTRSRKVRASLFLLALVSAGAVLAASTTPLGKVMALMGLDLMKIQSALPDPASNAQTLLLLRDLREKAGQAHELTPAGIVGQDDRITAYRAKIEELIAAIARTEDALNHNNQDEAIADFADIKRIRGEGHTAFKPPTP